MPIKQTSIKTSLFLIEKKMTYRCDMSVSETSTINTTLACVSTLMEKYFYLKRRLYVYYVF